MYDDVLIDNISQMIREFIIANPDEHKSKRISDGLKSLATDIVAYVENATAEEFWGEDDDDDDDWDIGWDDGGWDDNAWDSSPVDDEEYDVW